MATRQSSKDAGGYAGTTSSANRQSSTAAGGYSGSSGGGYSGYGGGGGRDSGSGSSGGYGGSGGSQNQGNANRQSSTAAGGYSGGGGSNGGGQNRQSSTAAGGYGGRTSSPNRQSATAAGGSNSGASRTAAAATATAMGQRGIGRKDTSGTGIGGLLGGRAPTRQSSVDALGPYTGSYLTATPRTQPFRDPTRFSYARGSVPNADALANALSPRGLSMLANLETAMNLGRPMPITSGYRSPEYNRQIYEARGQTPTDSEHSRHKAVDLGLTDRTEQRRALELAKDMGFTGLGNYKDANLGVHIDVGPMSKQVPGTPRGWGGIGLDVARNYNAQEPAMGAIAAQTRTPTFGSPQLTNAQIAAPSPKIQDRLSPNMDMAGYRSPMSGLTGMPQAPGLQDAVQGRSANSMGPGGYGGFPTSPPGSGMGFTPGLPRDGLGSPSAYGGGPGPGGIVQGGRRDFNTIAGMGNPSGNFGGPGFAGLQQDAFNSRGIPGQGSPSAYGGGPGFAGLDQNAFDNSRGTRQMASANAATGQDGYGGFPTSPPGPGMAFNPGMPGQMPGPSRSRSPYVSGDPQIAGGIPNQPGREAYALDAQRRQWAPGITEPKVANVAAPGEPMDLNPPAPHNYGKKPGAPAPGIIGPSPYMNPRYSFGVPGRPKGTLRSSVAPRGVQTAMTTALGLAGLPGAGLITDGLQALGARARQGRVGNNPGGPYTEGADHSGDYAGGSGARDSIPGNGEGGQWTGTEPPQAVAQMQQHVEQVLASYFATTPQTQFPQYSSGQWSGLPTGAA